MVSSTVAFDKKSSSTPVESTPVDQNDSSTISSMPFSSSSACNDTTGVLTHDSSGGSHDASALSFSEQKISLLFPKCKPRSDYHYVVSGSACANGTSGKNNNCMMDVGGLSLGSTHSLATYVTRASPPVVAQTVQGSAVATSKGYIDMGSFGNNNGGGGNHATAVPSHASEFEYGAEQELAGVGKALQLNACGLNNNIGGGANNNNHYGGGSGAGSAVAGGGAAGSGGVSGGGMGMKGELFGMGGGSSMKHTSNQSVSKNTPSADGYSFYYSNQPPSLTCSPTENQSAISVAALGNSGGSCGGGGGGGGGVGGAGLLLSDDEESSERSKKDTSGAARWMERNYCHLSVSHYPMNVPKSKSASAGGGGGCGGGGGGGGGVGQLQKRSMSSSAYKPVNCYNMVLQSPLEDESDMEDKLKYFNYQHEMQTYNSTRKDKLSGYTTTGDLHCSQGGIGSGDGEEIVVLSSNAKEHGNSLSVAQPLDCKLDESGMRKGVLHMGQKLEHVPFVGLSVASPSVEGEQTLEAEFADKVMTHYPIKSVTMEDGEERNELKSSTGSNIIEYDGSPRRFGLNLCDESDCYLASSVKINLTSPSLLTLPRPGFPQRVVPPTTASSSSNGVATAQTSSGNVSCSPSLLDQVNSTLSKTILLDSKNPRSLNDNEGSIYSSSDVGRAMGARMEQDHHVYDVLPCDVKPGKPSPSESNKRLEKIQLNTHPSEDELTVGSSGFPPIANSSTFDYLYEFSETRKVLEEFFKCPSTEDVEKFSDYNDSADEDGESLDVQYDYPVDLERSKTIETTYIGNVNGSGKQDNLSRSPKSPMLSDGPMLEEEDDDTADVEDEEEDDEKENALVKYNYKLKSKPRMSDYCGLRKKKTESHTKGHSGVGLGIREGTERFNNLEYDRREDDGVRLSLKSSLQTANDARDYAMYVQSGLLKSFPEPQPGDSHSHNQTQQASQHSNVNELRFSAYINGESRTSSYDAINDSNYDAHPIISNGNDKDSLHFSLNGDGGDGRKVFARKYSKNFNYSPDTTDYDSNCGDYDSEISPQYGSDFGLISGTGATMCDDLNNGVISATSGPPTGTGESLNCLFANNANNYSRYYAAMPVLEDGLSSGHVSDSENNLNANAMPGVLPPDLVSGSVKQLTSNSNGGGLMQTSGGSAYGMIGSQSPSVTAKQSISSSPIASKELKGTPGSQGQPQQLQQQSLQTPQQQQTQGTNVEGFFVNNTFRMGNLKLNSSMLHNASIFKNRDPELESLYTINTIQSTPPPPAPAPHRKSSIDCDNLSSLHQQQPLQQKQHQVQHLQQLQQQQQQQTQQQPQQSQQQQFNHSQVSSSDVQSTLKDIRLCLQKTKNLTLATGNQTRKTFDKPICSGEFPDPLGGGNTSGGGVGSNSGNASGGAPSLSPIWIPRTRVSEDFSSKPIANGVTTIQNSVGGSCSNNLSNGLQSVQGTSCKLSSSPSSLHTTLPTGTKTSATVPGAYPEETEELIGQSPPAKTMALVDEDEDPDTDLETDRLLGHQRLDDQGFYDESNNKLWNSDRKTGSRLLALGKLSPKQQGTTQPSNSGNAGTAGPGVVANGKAAAQGPLGDRLGGVGTRASQQNGSAASSFLPTSSTSGSGLSTANATVTLPDIGTTVTTMASSATGNTVNGVVGSGVPSCHKSAKTSGNLINFNGPNEPQTQLTSPNPSPQHSLSEGNLLDKSNDSGSPGGSTKSKSLRNNETKRKSKNKEVLIEGVLFRARYLGSTQLVCEGQPTKSTRMLQAEEAVSRIKALSPDGEVQPSTEVDLFISTEKIMVLNTDLKEIMMDHALRTISYIADIGDLVVLMARRRFVPQDVDSTDSSGGAGTGSGTHGVSHVTGGSTPSQKLASGPKGNRTPKMICHVFESEEAQFIAQSIGQAFQVAYMEFLKANGIEDHSFMKEMDYQEVLNSQEIFGDELEIFAKKELQKEVVVPKAKGEILGVVIVESGWGSMLPTVVIANLASAGAAARCGQLNIGDQIIAINGLSLVGLPLSTCQGYIKNTKNQTVVKFTVVPCAPVVEVKIKRPNTKYQLGFSVQNGVICSLLRGGIAERGGVRVGHRIIEINNQSVVAVPHEKIVNLLATSVGEILMKTMPTSMFRLLTGQENPIYI